MAEVIFEQTGGQLDAACGRAHHEQQSHGKPHHSAAEYAGDQMVLYRLECDEIGEQIDKERTDRHGKYR